MGNKLPDSSKRKIGWRKPLEEAMWDVRPLDNLVIGESLN